MVRFLTSILLALFAFFPLGGAYGYETSGQESAMYSSIKDPSVEYQVIWKLWTLLGEPVYDAKIRWNFEGTGVAKRSAENGGNIVISQQPKAALAGIRLYDVKVRLIGHARGDHKFTGAFTLDVGIPAKAGSDWSYNTPTSPNWEKFLEVAGYYGSTGKPAYQSGEAARRMLKKGFVVSRVELVKPKFSYSSFDEWRGKKKPEQRARTLTGAIQSQIEAIKTLAGLPVKKIQSKLESLNTQLLMGKDTQFKALQDLQKLYDRLSEGVPIHMVSPSRQASYSQRVAKLNKQHQQQLFSESDRQAYQAWEKAKLKLVSQRDNQSPEAILKTAKAWGLLGGWQNECFKSGYSMYSYRHMGRDLVLNATRDYFSLREGNATALFFFRNKKLYMMQGTDGGLVMEGKGYILSSRPAAYRERYGNKIELKVSKVIAAKSLDKNRIRIAVQGAGKAKPYSIELRREGANRIYLWEENARQLKPSERVNGVRQDENQARMRMKKCKSSL